MIQEQLGSALKPSNIKNKTMELSVSDSALQGTNTGDAVRAAMDMTRDLGEENVVKKPIKKTDSKKLVGKSKMKLPIGKIFTMGKITENKLFDITKKEMDELVNEKWSQKYKDSIDCKNPKGFSQKAHCQGKKKKTESKESTGAGDAGGFIGPIGFNADSKFVKDSFKETPKKVESNEATGSGSAGSYVTPAAWAKTMKKGDWRGKSKTQIPGGQFVQVKKKCKKFPYCNQGDIKALNLSETIKKVSLKYGISENVVKDILKLEFGKNSNNKQK